MTSRTWLITGVSPGFGRELTGQLLERGDRVIGTVRDTSKIADLTDRYPDTFIPEVLEMTDPTAVRHLVNRTFDHIGRVNAIVSNAGYGLFGAAEELPDEQVEHIIATNLTGSITPSARHSGIALATLELPTWPRCAAPTSTRRPPAYASTSTGASSSASPSTINTTLTAVDDCPTARARR